MKFTTLAVTAALVCAVTGYKHGGDNDHHHNKPKSTLSLNPGVEVQTKPPVVVIKTVTVTTSLLPHEKPTFAPKPPHWNGKKQHKNKKHGDKLHAAAIKSVDADEAIEAAEVSGAAENLAAAQASATPTGISPAKSSAVASKISSAVASASASARASASGAENVRTGGTFVAAAAGIAAYLLL